MKIQSKKLSKNFSRVQSKVSQAIQAIFDALS